MDNIINDYYNNQIKIKDIIDKYNLGIQSNKLFKSFPPAVLKDVRCKYDNSCALASLNSRTSYEFSGKIDKKSAYCPKCKHKIYDKYCNCNNCRNEHEKENINKLNALISESSRDKLNYKFLSDIDDYSKLVMSAYIRGFLNENMDFINDLNSSNNRILPKYDLEHDPDVQFVISMRDNNYICFSPASNLSSFVFEKGNDDKYIIKAYYPANVKYDINLLDDSETSSDNGTDDKTNVINKLMYPDKDIFLKNKDLCYKIWKKINLMECKEYLLNELSKVRMDSFKPGKKTDSVINHLLDNFSASQIFGFIHNRVNNALRYYQESNVSKKRAANAIITNLEHIGERALANNWDVTNYHRDYDIRESELSKLFFDYILGISDQGFYSVPTKDI